MHLLLLAAIALVFAMALTVCAAVYVFRQTCEVLENIFRVQAAELVRTVDQLRELVSELRKLHAELQQLFR